MQRKNDARARGEWQGMNWIRQDKRLAIYLRDGLACVYCGAGVESHAVFTLDHIKPYSKGGSNDAANLVTCCERCNKVRCTRGLRSWCGSVAGYLYNGATTEMIEAHVRNVSRRSLAPYRNEAKVMIARRGSVARVLAAM